ncbi:Dabb family protein [Mycolicibacterium austroafricanum]|uniref:Dabb family protein n=1 Tax=Mycolicibacterium austroafricanum TaxID=39687 RepID=UPI001CA37639|nr:Dabb family protein [Mycolicibacterium austroafricanum]QZT64851.1 Dabb family protein [Mycolicibacterium austroafricanum]
MIRHVVLAKFKTGYDAAEVRRLQDGFRALNCPGTVRYTVGSDAGLREGNWDFAIVADFEDAAAFRGYDEDAAHGELRSRLSLFVEQAARVQFEVPQS